jgi:Asp-tRNA(Asn)/Glu-tRNA(Gln) amidotransferase A subunit family amidase
MDTNGPKTPVPLPFAAWQAMPPAQAAREVHVRIAALPEKLRNAALAWLKPEAELAAELETNSIGASLLATTGNEHPRVEEGRPAPRSPLHNVPYLLKDLFDVARVPTRAGSTFLDQVRPTPGDSAIVQRLRALGAALAGKTHLVEFASGLTGENPHYGDCPHPYFPDRLSGGSSNGSAALVAAGVTPLAIGTDTGGSVRVPASWCGVCSFRRTPGDELVRDAFPLALTMDTCGWFTANAADMLTAWRALVDSAPSHGPHAHARSHIHSGERSPRPPEYSPRGLFLRLRDLLPGADRELDEACARAAAQFAAPADRLTRASLLAAWRDSVDTYVTIGMNEAHAVHRDWLAPYREHYDPVIWQRFTDAGKWPSGKITAARAKLETIRHDWGGYFGAHDFLVLPAVPAIAPTKAECTPELRRNILTLTAPASLGGLPCLTLPVPLTHGFSAGLQIIAPEPASPVFEWMLQLSRT